MWLRADISDIRSNISNINGRMMELYFNVGQNSANVNWSSQIPNRVYRSWIEKKGGMTDALVRRL